MDMSLIKSSETKPERQIRAELFRMGFRFRKNDRRVLGKHDIVLSHYRAFIFVNGCFFHAHGCSRFKMPKTNPEFWEKKFERNKARDKEQVEKLLKEGWRVGLVWECSILGKKRSVKITDVASRICYWLEEEPHERFREF